MGLIVVGFLALLTGCDSPTDSLTAGSACSIDSPEDVARTMWGRVVGIYKPSRDKAAMDQVIQLFNEGKALEAGRILVEQRGFVDYALKTLAARMKTLDNSPNPAMDSFTAFVMGIGRDNRSIKDLFANGLYVVRDDLSITPPAIRIRNENHWKEMADRSVSPFEYLVWRGAPQWREEDEVDGRNDIAAGYNDFAGIMTTSPVANYCAGAGTNRRYIQYILYQLLGRSLESAHSSDMGQFYIGRDVLRGPDFNNCIGCHGGMDAMRAAFAYVDGQPTGGNYHLRLYTSVRNKFNQNQKHPTYQVTSRFWVNLFNTGINQQEFGWRGSVNQGSSIASLMQMVANSEAFTNKMVKRVFEQLHLKDPDLDPGMAARVKEIARTVEGENHSLKDIFAHVAAVPQCK